MVELLVIIIAMVVIFFILFQLKKTLFLFGFFFRLISIAFIVLIVGGIVFGYYIIKDANTFRNNFGNSSNMFLLKQNIDGKDHMLVGVTINYTNKTFDTLTQDKLSDIEKAYDEGKLNTLTKDYYKIFVIDMSSVDNISLYNISDKNVMLTKDEMKEVLLSSDARSTFAGIMAQKQHQDKDVVMGQLSASSEEIKGYVFSYYLMTVFNTKNMDKFLTEFRDGRIKVYDETTMFTAIKLFPSVLMNQIV